MKILTKLILVIVAGLMLAQCSTYKIKPDVNKSGVVNKVPKWYVKYDRSTMFKYQEAATAVSPDLELAVKKAVLLAKAKLVSIDTQVNDSDKNTLGDVIPDENTQNPLENIVRSGDYDQIRSNLDCLSSREKEVITKRFGLNDNSPSTFIEIAQKMGLTKERVRQIEEYALVKMRRLFYLSNDDKRFSCAT